MKKKSLLKRFAAMLLVCVTLFTFTACGAGDNQQTKSKTFKNIFSEMKLDGGFGFEVVASEEIIYKNMETGETEPRDSVSEKYGANFKNIDGNFAYEIKQAYVDAEYKDIEHVRVEDGKFVEYYKYKNSDSFTKNYKVPHQDPDFMEMFVSLILKYGEVNTSLFNYVGGGKYYETDDGYVMSVDFIAWLKAFLANANTVCDNLTDSTTINDVYASLGFEDIINCFDGVKVSELVSDLSKLDTIVHIDGEGDVNEFLKSAGLPELRRENIDLPDYIKEQVLNQATTVLGENMIIGKQTVLGLVRNLAGQDLINIQNIKDAVKGEIDNYLEQLDIFTLKLDFCCDEKGKLLTVDVKYSYKRTVEEMIVENALSCSIGVSYNIDLLDVSKIDIGTEVDGGYSYSLNETGTGYKLTGIGYSNIVYAPAYIFEDGYDGDNIELMYCAVPKEFNGKPVVEWAYDNIWLERNVVIELPKGIDVKCLKDTLDEAKKDRSVLLCLVIENDFECDDLGVDDIQGLYLKGTEEDFKDNAFVKAFIEAKGEGSFVYYNENNDVSGCWHYEILGGKKYPVIVIK